MAKNRNFDLAGQKREDAAATDHADVRTLRVAYLTPTYFSAESVVGGGERYVSNLAHALKVAQISDSLPYRFAPTILSIGPEPKLFVQDGIPIRVLPNNTSSENPMDGTSALLWSELSDYDLIHVHQSLTIFGAYCSVIAKTLRKPLILTDLGGGANPVMLSGKGLQLADGIISISNFAHSFIAPHFSGPHEVIIGPVDTDFFTVAASTGCNKLTAICVSRILPHKGIDRIIKALPPALKLRVVGRVYDAAYHKTLTQMSVGKDIEFIHDADDQRLLSLYQSSDLFIQASTFRDCNGNVTHKPELMGLTTLEALACGLPVIVSDAGSLPELVADHNWGRVFSTDDELEVYLNDFRHELWPQRGSSQEARSHVVNNYSYNAVGFRLSNFYASIYYAS
jgi:glycosyltransferase involved in cell wall biosynthesis